MSIEPMQATQWIQGLHRRDPQALRAIYEFYRNDVTAVAATVLGRARADAAADVLQDVFVGLARVATTLPVDTHLRAYLVRAAVNRARDQLRRPGRSDAGLGDLAAAGPEVPVVVGQDEEARELWRQVSLLPEEQRSVVGLRVWGGQNFREIAAALKISENTAQSRWRYAISKLRQHYEGVER